MARNLNPKCKQCRREGVKLFLKGERCSGSKCALVKRNYIPGVHGVRLGKGGRMTGYGLQLREKQKAKRAYHILEKQFKNYFTKATKKRGNTAEYLYALLESRMDNIIYRAGFAGSYDSARQMVSHGSFLVNGRRSDIPSRQLKVKDKITIKATKKELGLFKDLAERLKTREIPEWLNVDAKEAEITVIGLPSLATETPSYDLKQIIEFYSR